MNRILIGALAALALGATAGAFVIASGIIEVGAGAAQPGSPSGTGLCAGTVDCPPRCRNQGSG